MGELTDQEAELIEAFIREGKVRRFPSGETSGWDERPLKEKQKIKFQAAIRRWHVKDAHK